MSTHAERSERCETCRFWVQDSSECHRYAPATVTGRRKPDSPDGREAARAWPLTVADDWCGDWSASSGAQAVSEDTRSVDSVATRVFLARVAPTLDARNPGALVESLLEQLPPDVRRVIVLMNGLEGQPRAALRTVARELKISQGHVRALAARGDELLAEVVGLITREREKV